MTTAPPITTAAQCAANIARHYSSASAAPAPTPAPAGVARPFDITLTHANGRIHVLRSVLFTDISAAAAWACARWPDISAARIEPSQHPRRPSHPPATAIPAPTIVAEYDSATPSLSPPVLSERSTAAERHIQRQCLSAATRAQLLRASLIHAGGLGESWHQRLGRSLHRHIQHISTAVRAWGA